MKNMIILFALCVFISCEQQSQDEKISNTIQCTLAALENSDYKTIRSLVRYDSDTDMESIIYKVTQAKYFIDKYHGANTKNMKTVTNDSLDELSRKKISINLFNGFDSATGIMNCQLILYVGPPQIIPLTKLSGFKIVTEANIDWRIRLMDEKKLFDFDSIAHLEYDKYMNR